METYKNIDEFIREVFPLKNEEIIKEKKSEIAESVEIFDAEFDEKLKAIIKGADETETPASPEEESQ